MQDSSNGAPTSGARARWLWELPFVGGVLGGVALLWLRGGLFVFDGTVSGYHWPEWLHNAWHVVHARWDRMSGFRKPLHGYLVGMVGEVTGYDDSAILVASVSGMVMLLSAALIARVLAGPAAGGLAAFTLGAVPLVANATHWGNGYPLLAATTGAALAGSALLAAHPSRRALALATGTAIAALASEDRGVLVLPWVLGMTALALRDHRRPSVRWFALAALLVAVVPPAIDAGLGHRAPFALSAADKRTAQKDVVYRWLQIEPDPQLVSTCASIKLTETLEPAFFQTPCARAVLTYNSQTIAPKATFFSGTALALGLLGWLVGPRPRRALVWTGGICGGVAWLVFATATPMPHRYILQFVVPLVVVVPVAVGRLGWLAGRGWRGWILSLLTCFTVGVWGWVADPHDRSGLWQRTRGDWSQPEWAAEAKLVREYTPSDERVLDCLDHGINSAILPHHVVGPAPFLTPDPGFCVEWITHPTRFGAAPRWVVVGQGVEVFDSGARQKVRLDTLVAKTERWTLAAEQSDIELWVRR